MQFMVIWWFGECPIRSEEQTFGQRAAVFLRKFSLSVVGKSVCFTCLQKTSVIKRSYMYSIIVKCILMQTSPLCITLCSYLLIILCCEVSDEFTSASIQEADFIFILQWVTYPNCRRKTENDLRMSVFALFPIQYTSHVFSSCWYQCVKTAINTVTSWWNGHFKITDILHSRLVLIHGVFSQWTEAS